MKRFLIVTLIFAVAILSSCNKDKSGPETTSNPDINLPAKAATYIDDNYPDAIIDNIVTLTGNEASYLVTLNTDEELAFDNEGGFLGNGEEFHGGQPQCDTIYGGHHGGPHHGGGIPIDSLSTLITDYITANYPGFEIRHARYDTVCPDGAVTEVVIALPDSIHLRLFFGAGDAFLMQANRMLYIDVPQAVKDYISANYADSTVKQKATKLTLADNSLQYWIYIRTEELKTRVRMAEDGAFICDQSRVDTTHGGPHPGGPHPGGHHGGIPIDSLSAAIKDYVAANYAGYSIQHANHENICPTGKVTFVMIGMPETQPIGLVFGTADEFLMTKAPVAYEEVPQPVKDYIAANYPEYQAEERSEMLNLADGSQDYLVHLRKHHGNKIVHLTSDGTFLCEQ